MLPFHHGICRSKHAFLFVVTALILARFVPLNAEETAAVFYVSTVGNDQWSGQKAEAAGNDGPFATLDRARQAVRALKKNPGFSRDIIVYLRGGTYPITAPLTFSEEDSAPKWHKIVYAAFEKEQPVISGGKVIKNWHQEKDLWVTELPEAGNYKWFFSQLFFEGRRLKRCRAPNHGYFRIEKPLRTPPVRLSKEWKDPECRSGFYYRAGDLEAWDDVENMNIFMLHAWTASVHWVKNIDAQVRTLHFTANAEWPIGQWDRTQRYYVENVRAALDEPGEWYLDGRIGKLYYFPRPDEQIQNFAPVAPVCEQLLVIAGNRSKKQPVENLYFQGIRFQHAAWNLPRPMMHDGQAAAKLTAAVYVKDAEKCGLENVEIAHVGQYGLWFAPGSQYCFLRKSELSDLGAGGVKIGDTTNKTPETAALGNTVDNCFIHDGGHLAKSGIGVWIGRSSYHNVTHNEICDLDYSAVSVGWNWGYAPSAANHNQIKYNYLHHIGNGVLSDMGAIYTLGQAPGTEISHNVIHDVYAYSYGGWGLYTDEGSSDVVLEKNVVYNTKSGGFHQNYGRDNIVRNNFLLFSGESQVIRNREEAHNSFLFENNIVVTNNGCPLGYNWGNGNFRNRNNLYWDLSGTKLNFDGLELADWQTEEGQDIGSRMADPLFRDATKRDFHLLPDSPALKMGIDSLDYTLDHAGLYDPEEWVRKPRNLINRPLDPDMLPPQKTIPPFSSNNTETLEDLAVGEKIGFAGTGEEGGATIRVTDELGCHSKHSLKFTDADKQANVWQPYLDFKFNWRKGTIRASYDVYIKPGARFWNEWRMSSSPHYKVGVCLRFTENGKLLVNTGKEQKEIADYPRGEWFKVEIICPTESEHTTGYVLNLTLSNGQTQKFELPLRDPEWRYLSNMIFSSEADHASEFYLDNFHFVQQK